MRNTAYEKRNTRGDMTDLAATILGVGDWWTKTVNYELVRGNAIWRFGLVLLAVLVTMVAGRVVQFVVSSYATRLA